MTKEEKTLIDFLDKKELTKKFEECLSNSFNLVDVSSIAELVEKVPRKEDYITVGFIWGKTSDGKEFWNNVHCEWVEFCSKESIPISVSLSDPDVRADINTYNQAFINMEDIL